MTATHSLVILTCLCVWMSHICEAYPFKDVSRQAGLSYAKGKQIKYGGACVADLDGDGWADLLFGHHTSPYTEAYFNQRDGTFAKAQWGVHVDAHGFVPFHASTWARSMSFILSRGGSYGKAPRPPLIFRVTPQRKIITSVAPTFASGRGRTAVILSMRPRSPGKTSSAIFLNAAPIDGKVPFHRAADIIPVSSGYPLSPSVRLIQRRFTGLARETNYLGTAVDIDGDGLMELALFQELRIYKVLSFFGLVDVSRKVLPPGIDWRGVAAVAEFDYNNDGLMDLYIARTTSFDLKWLRRLIGTGPSDILLRNVGGRFVDASRQARIPFGGDSRGVTTGDFNNDGYIDILVTQLDTPHRLLFNNGDGTFRTTMPNFGRHENRPADGAVAVDYDRDGRLDVIASYGHYFNANLGGYYHIMRNVGRHGNFLLIRVGHSPKRGTTSLYALVRAFANGGKHKMTRRIGSPGTTVSSSYIELVHFGLGSFKSADVVVRWSDGSTHLKRNLKANSITLFGVV